MPPKVSGTYVECLICASPCEALALFPCGHYVCYVCGLHIHFLDNRGCPMCRECGTVCVTRTVPGGLVAGQDKVSSEVIRELESRSTTDKVLQCRVDGEELARELRKLYQFVCPVPTCWRNGRQEPFCQKSYLHTHLEKSHGVSYCSICHEHRPVFLAEQMVYSREALALHMEGKYQHDPASFLGHPPCRFCKGVYLYDGDYLLKHMREQHFTCDICNRVEFRFTYYENREKLLMHFKKRHKLCTHRECSLMDPIMRVFASDLDLAAHMQRVHGVRCHLDLFTLSGTESSGAAPAIPATGADANAVRIFFDHVSSVETLALVPSREDGKRNQVRLNGGGKTPKNKKEFVDIAPHDAVGLPKHFRFGRILAPIVCNVGTDTELADAIVCAVPAEGSKKQDEPSRAFGVSESEEMYNWKNNVPRDNEGQKRKLTEVIRELVEPCRITQLEICTANFIGGGMMTTEYYNKLQTEFFQTDKSFRVAFPLLVATMPLAEKRDALIRVDKMRNVPEMQHVRQAREEELKEEARREELAKQESSVLNNEVPVVKPVGKKNQNRTKSKTNSNSNVNVNGNSKAPSKKMTAPTAWTEKVKGALNGVANNDSTGTSSCAFTSSGAGGSATLGGSSSSNNNNAVTPPPRSTYLPAGSSWGTFRQHCHGTSAGAVNDAPARPLMSDFINLEDFPALPTTTTQRVPGNCQTKRNNKPNAWFSKS